MSISFFGYGQLPIIIQMYRNKNIEETLSSLKKLQQAGLSLEQATKTLHKKENVPFDDIWPAIMRLRQLSEKEAMRSTKDWCLHGKEDENI